MADRPNQNKRRRGVGKAAKAKATPRTKGSVSAAAPGAPRRSPGTTRKKVAARRPPDQRLGSVAALIRLVARVTPVDELDVAAKRRLLAGVCRLVMAQVMRSKSDNPPGFEGIHLAPRVRQTLVRLLLGDSEKEAARHLGASTHTVHVYVKTLYAKAGVASRSELMARVISHVMIDP